MDETNLPIASLVSRRFSRRTVAKLLGATAGLPALGALLAACGGGGSTPASTSTSTSTAVVNQPVTTGGTPLSTFSTPVVSSPATPAAAAAGASAVKGGTLHLALTIDPDALDPAKTIQLEADSVNVNIYDRLVFIGRDRLPHPWVSEKWDISPDGKQITFTIRPGISFHDDTALDGKAVKFTFDRILDPATASPAKAQMGTLQSVDLVDDTHVRFNFSDPYAPFFTNISLGYGGIVSPAGVQKYADKFGKNPVGSGPFKLKQWTAGQSIDLVRNENWKNFRTDGANTGVAYLDGIQFKEIAEAATRLAALQSGELDVSDVDVQQVTSIQNNPKYQIVIWKDATDHNFIEYANKAPFTDVAVRQAIAYSIDRDSIVKSAWNGFATANLLPMPVGVAGWDASIGQQYGYAYDLTKAKKTLTDAGYAPGADGIMAKDGKSLSFTLLVYSGAAPAKTASEIIQAALKQIGVDMKIQIIEFGSELPMLNAGNFEADWMRWTWPDPVILSLLFKTPGWTKQTHDPDLDKLLNVPDTTLDPTKRLDGVHAALTYILQKAIIAPIATDWIVRAARSVVKGYQWDAIGYPMYTDVSLSQ